MTVGKLNEMIETFEAKTSLAIVTAILQEMDSRTPGFAQAVVSRVAAKLDQHQQYRSYGDDMVQSYGDDLAQGLAQVCADLGMPFTENVAQPPLV